MRGGDRVPSEFLGRARLLRNRVAAAFAEAEPQMAELLAPLRPRPGFAASPSDRYFRDLARRWRRLPGVGRLRLFAEATAGGLDIVEFRLIPMKITAADWEDDEPALGVGAIVVAARRLKPLRERRVVLAAVGLHALARRYERGQRDDRSVLADLVALGRDVVGGDNADVAVPTGGGGRWVCRRHADNSLIVRSFLAEGQAAAGFQGPAVRARVVRR